MNQASGQKTEERFVVQPIGTKWRDEDRTVYMIRDAFLYATEEQASEAIATLTAEAAELRADKETLKAAITAIAAVLEKLMESFKVVADVSQKAREGKIIRNATDAESFLRGTENNVRMANHMAAKELIKIDKMLTPTPSVRECGE